MTDKQITTYCDDVKETALRQFYKIQNQRKEISLLHKKCAIQQAEIERLTTLSELGKMRSNDYRVMRDRALKAEAEIERLTINMNAFGLGMKREKERADTTRAEAIKEFAERLQYEIDYCDEQGEIFINARSIKEVLKEMVGE